MNDTDKLYDDITKIIFSRHPRIKGAYCGLIAYGVMGYIAALNSDRAAAKVGANVAADSIDTEEFQRLATEWASSAEISDPDWNPEATLRLWNRLIAHIDARIDAGAPAETPLGVIPASADLNAPGEVNEKLLAYLNTAEQTAPAETPKPEPKDWPEDFAHENGNYQNRCGACGGLFIGHKRRITCKECAAQPAPIAGDVEKDAARYQWMRRTFINDEDAWPDDVAEAKTGEQLDAAVDAAMLASPSPRKAG